MNVIPKPWLCDQLMAVPGLMGVLGSWIIDMSGCCRSLARWGPWVLGVLGSRLSDMSGCCRSLARWGSWVLGVLGSRLINKSGWCVVSPWPDGGLGV